MNFEDAGTAGGGEREEGREVMKGEKKKKRKRKHNKKKKQQHCDGDALLTILGKSSCQRSDDTERVFTYSCVLLLQAVRVVFSECTSARTKSTGRAAIYVCQSLH